MESERHGKKSRKTGKKGRKTRNTLGSIMIRTGNKQQEIILTSPPSLTQNILISLSSFKLNVPWSRVDLPYRLRIELAFGFAR
jgi:hypothetical protein